MRRLRVALCLAGLALAVGCGGEEGTGSGALGYVSPDAGGVVLVPTDLDSEQAQRFERLLEPTFGASLREALGDLFDDENVTFERDIEPLLGETMVLATGVTDEDSVLLALEGELRIEVPNGLD